MKEIYITPAIEVIEYEVEDVITTSVFDIASNDNEFEDKWVKVS